MDQTTARRMRKAIVEQTSVVVIATTRDAYYGRYATKDNVWGINTGARGGFVRDEETVRALYPSVKFPE